MGAGGYTALGARPRDRRERPESFSFHRARRGARARGGAMGGAGGAAPGARGAGRLFPPIKIYNRFMKRSTTECLPRELLKNTT